MIYLSKCLSKVGVLKYGVGRNSIFSVYKFNTIGRLTNTRQFHTTRPNSIHPLVWLVIRPIAKIGAIIAGRTFRKWWSNLPPDKRMTMWSKIKANKRNIYIGGAAFTSQIVLYYITHLEETPITKRSRFVAFSDSQFAEVADLQFKTMIDMLKGEILPVHHRSYKAVVRIANKLLQANKDLHQLHDKDWSVTVVNNKTQNAFVLPNGQIFVFEGMMELCENEDQLGIVLAHEMAHSVLRHGAEQMSYTHLMDFFMVMIIAVIWAIIPSDILSALVQFLVSQLVSLSFDLPYNRMLENEADLVGLQLAAKACLDVRESTAFWAKMHLRTEMGRELTPPEFLSTHPNHDTRADNLQKLMPDALEIRRRCRCPPLPLIDPRMKIEQLKKRVYMDSNPDLYRVRVSPR